MVRSINLILLSLIFLTRQNRTVLPVIICPKLGNAYGATDAGTLVSRLCSIFPSIRIRYVQPSSSPLRKFCSIFSGTSSRVTCIYRALHRSPHLRKNFGTVNLSRKNLVVQKCITVYGGPPIHGLVALKTPRNKIGIVPKYGTSCVRDLMEHVRRHVDALKFLPGQLLYHILHSAIRDTVCARILRRLFVPTRCFQSPGQLRSCHRTGAFLTHVGGRFSPHGTACHQGVRDLHRLILCHCSQSRLIRPSCSP